MHDTKLPLRNTSGSFSAQKYLSVIRIMRYLSHYFSKLINTYFTLHK